MSRIGSKPVLIPNGVKVSIKDNIVFVEGPKGKLQQEVKEGISVVIDGQNILVNRSSDDKKQKAFHGLFRSLIANIVKGVVEKYSKKLEIVGVGYRATMKGKDLDLSIGKTHPVIYKGVEGIEIKTPDQTHIEISGIDKQKVGQVAAEIRDLSKPEPYKGKGIRYEGEHVRKKEGKAVK